MTDIKAVILFFSFSFPTKDELPLKFSGGPISSSKSEVCNGVFDSETSADVNL